MLAHNGFNGLGALPLLGGFNAKAAAAYLLPPTDKVKKKKKPTPIKLPEEELDKEAAFSEEAILEQQAIMQRQLQSGDFVGGWNPFKQV
jgi:hypothetical protein